MKNPKWWISKKIQRISFEKGVDAKTNFLEV
jgi:hypothetical protein